MTAGNMAEITSIKLKNWRTASSIADLMIDSCSLSSVRSGAVSVPTICWNFWESSLTTNNIILQFDGALMLCFGSFRKFHSLINWSVELKLIKNSEPH